MPKQNSEVALRNQLRAIVLRRSCVKEFTKTTELYEAALQQQLEQEGMQQLDGGDGSSASFLTVSSWKLPDNPKQIMELLDVRTMASLLAGSTVTAEKQRFLERIYSDIRSRLIEKPSSQFRINLPRSAEQVETMRKLIEADKQKLEENVETMLRSYQEIKEQKARPVPADFDAKAKEPEKKTKRAKKA